MKKLIKPILSVLVIILLIILIIQNNQDNIKFKRTFEQENKTKIKLTIKKDNKVNILTTKEANNYLKEGTGVILIGSPKDNKTRKILPIILEETQKKETQFNYLDQKNVDKQIKNKIKEEDYPLIIYTISGKIEAISKYDENKTNKELKKEYNNNIDKLYGVCDSSC